MRLLSPTKRTPKLFTPKEARTPLKTLLRPKVLIFFYVYSPDSSLLLLSLIFFDIFTIFWLLNSSMESLMSEMPLNSPGLEALNV